MRKELEYLQDPWKLALNVENQLAKGQIDEAMVLTQMASKDMAVTVAWNHIIDYLFKNQKLHAAMRTFNDVR
jgi:pentatricopeptide repeat protein